jgi:hypothetical protein
MAKIRGASTDDEAKHHLGLAVLGAARFRHHCFYKK